jgi:predicted dinucleotide-binding enzyme
MKHGDEVMLGTRDTAKLENWKAENPGGKIGSFEDAARFSDTIVLAGKGAAAEAILESAGKANLEGKVVIDATNPISEAPPANGVLKFFTAQNESLMEHLQDRFPEARFVKAFNSVGAHLMVNPDLGQRPTMFIAGNDNAAKVEVTSILDLFGWDTEDMGTAEAARAIEPLCMLWCIPGFRENQWAHAFKLLK